MSSPRIVLILFLSLVLSACQPAPNTFRVGTNVWPAYELLYLARDQGQFDASIKLVELPSASDVIDALRSGRLEAGALTLDEAVSLQQNGLDLVVVLVFNESIGADQLLAHPSITRLSELKGKTIAVETTAVGALMVKAALDMAELDIQDVKIKHLEPHEQLMAYQRGMVHAMITFAPHTHALEEVGAQLLFDSSAMPGQILDVLVVRRDAINDRALRQLLAGYFTAQTFLNQNPKEALSIINRRLKLSSEQLPLAYEGVMLPNIAENHALLTGDSSPLILSGMRLASLMHQRGLITNIPELTHFTSQQWLPPIP